eukprot:1162071-Pelagomonas_calceolata.AAC.4
MRHVHKGIVQLCTMCIKAQCSNQLRQVCAKRRLDIHTHASMAWRAAKTHPKEQSYMLLRIQLIKNKSACKGRAATGPTYPKQTLILLQH